METQEGTSCTFMDLRHMDAITHTPPHATKSHPLRDPGGNEASWLKCHRNERTGPRNTATANVYSSVVVDKDTFPLSWPSLGLKYQFWRFQKIIGIKSLYYLHNIDTSMFSK